VEVTLCEDVWMAVVETARANGRRTLVVGRPEELAREGGQFFRVASPRSVRFCCVLERSTVREAEGLVLALQAGVSVVAQADVPDVVTRWLSNHAGAPSRAAPAPLANEHLRPTSEELIALLGPGTNA
jgi:hypothetical protein